MPKNAQAVATLRKNVAVLWVPPPAKGTGKKPGAKITKIAQLAGHRVGVVGRTQANVNLLKVILQQYGVDPTKVDIVQFPAPEAAEAIRNQKADAYLAAGPVNSRGEVVGIAENNTRDPECPSTPAVNGTGPQVLDFEAVVWGPGQGQIRELSPLPGNTVGMALGINDQGQVAGMSGSCANTIIPPFVAAPHAVLWEADGSVHDLGNLGGTVNTDLLSIGNAALAINNRGQVAGVSALPGNQSTHAFLWTKKTGIRDLGTLPGDVNSAGLAINDRGDVVGGSIDGDLASGNPRPFIWQNGVMSDLNDLIPADSPLYLLVAFWINDAGEIAGFGVTGTGEIHAFLATPTKRHQPKPGNDSH